MRNAQKSITWAFAAVLLAACPAHAQTRPSPFDEFRARLSELGNGLRTARGQFSRKKSSATRFEEVKDKLVVIVCGEKAGSGFIVRDGGRPYLFTNAHVVQRGAVIAHRLDGTRLMLGPRDEAVGRDMVRFALDESMPGCSATATDAAW